ncbi:MAG: DHH family phosphoesterase, partial [Candidatus Zixiibacteriota bacterium]
MKLKETTRKRPTLKNPDTVIQEIEKFLLAGKRILLVSHIDPDGDAIGTLLAFAFYLKEIGKEYLAVMDSGIPYKYQFLPGIEEIKPVEQLDPGASFDTVLVLECPTLERAGRATAFINDRTTLINIDHHQDAELFGKVNWLDTEVSSVGEMAFEYFDKIGFKLSPAIAENLYTAILTDTGRFR